MRSLGWQQLEGVVLKLKLRRLSGQRRSVRRVLGQQVLNATDAERGPHANGGRRRKAREERRAHEFGVFFLSLLVLDLGVIFSFLEPLCSFIL
jgi:hypothetical protein